MPKKTTAVIIESENNYVIGVKRNQPNLYNQIQEVMSLNINCSSWHTCTEINRGRIETRTIRVSNQIEDMSKDWKGLQQIISVERNVKRDGKPTQEMAYFISSLNNNSYYYAEGIRLHWAIENSLHYVKDVTFKEDASKITKGNAPQNISTLKNIAINILRENSYHNMAKALRVLTNKVANIFDMIS